MVYLQNKSTHCAPPGFVASFELCFSLITLKIKANWFFFFFLVYYLHLGINCKTGERTKYGLFTLSFMTYMIPVLSFSTCLKRCTVQKFQHSVRNAITRRLKYFLYSNFVFKKKKKVKSLP